MLYIPITVSAAAFQVGRNALQRGLVADAGPWGATLVRFLFGLPFSLALLAAVWAFQRQAAGYRRHVLFGDTNIEKLVGKLLRKLGEHAKAQVARQQDDARIAPCGIKKLSNKCIAHPISA